MSGFFIGRNVKLLTDETQSPGIRIWRLELEQREFGHMSFRLEEQLHFLYVERGSVTCQVNQEKETAEAGEGIFINRGNAYRFVSSAGNGCTFLLFAVDANYVGDGPQGILTEKYVMPVAESENFPYLKLEGRGSSQEDILTGLSYAGEIAKKKECCYEMELKSAVYRVWSGIYREFVRLNPSLKRSACREAEKMKKMLSYLHSHYKEKITLGEMAAYSEVSSGEYCRFFKRRMEQTPFEYLQAYRIEQSMPQLLEKTESITEVALRHGFSGSSYYSETFKKEMGCSPGDYRKWYRGEGIRECPLKKTAEEETVRSRTAWGRDSMPAHLL
ncbi:MAG: AraC family transcriptional regulator [Eubacteriales bacterium]|nr:AraC family transcriptional regulator [Eubacteriales bacterium]